jgi:hypothetical protein
MWNQLHEIVGAELGELIGESFTPATQAPREVVQTSAIPLTLTAEHLQLRIGLGIDGCTMGALQSTLLGGDTSTEAMADAMREIANTAGGAVKRAALAAGVEFSIGLPSNTNLVACEGRAHHRAWTLRAPSGVELACVVIASSTAPKVVATRDLREGMVLARDVRNAMGTLIAPAGTNLTRTTVEQLSRILGAAASLEVTEIAA